MSLSPSIIKGHERAAELAAQWRKNGHANGSGSDNPKMFRYVIHLEDEVENLTKKLQSNNVDLGETAPNRPVVVGTPPTQARKPSTSLLAVAQELEETQQQLDLAQGEVERLKAELALSQTLAATASTTKMPSEIVEALAQIRNLSEGALAIWQTQQVDVTSFMEHVSSGRPKAPSMPIPPSTLKSDTKAQHQELAPPLPPVVKAEPPKAPKLTVVPDKAPPPAAEAPDEALTRINNLVKVWKKGIVVAKNPSGYAFSQKGDTFLTISRSGSGIWSTSGNVQNGLAKRVVVALRDELGYKI